jgi:hypothetical protein
MQWQHGKTISLRHTKHDIMNSFQLTIVSPAIPHFGINIKQTSLTPLPRGAPPHMLRLRRRRLRHLDTVGTQKPNRSC